MSRFLEPSDFTGKFKISKNCYDEAVLQEYIDKYEDLYLIRLLGSDLFDLFIADLDISNQPQTQIYIDIFEPFHKDLESFSERWNISKWYYNHNCILLSEGMVEMLKGFIYYHYVTAENVKHTIMGLTKSINENSSSASYEMIYRTGEVRYNEALNTYIDIQRYICEELESYPDWNGIKMNAKFYGIL